MDMQIPLVASRLRAALRRSNRLMRPRKVISAKPLNPLPTKAIAQLPSAPSPVIRHWLSLALSGIGMGLCASALVLWGLQLFLPNGQYFERIQIPLARQWNLPEREAIGWVSYADALLVNERSDEAMRAYGTAMGLLDTRSGIISRDLFIQIQNQSLAASQAKSIASLIHPSWGSVLLGVLRNPLSASTWLDALVAFPLIEEPQLLAMLMLSLWLAGNFIRSLQDQVAWTRILDQERIFSLGRLLPITLGSGLLALLLTALVSLSPSQPVMGAVVMGAAVPGLFVQILNRVYQLRSRQALAAWESQHRAEFSSELHNTAQQSIMNAQGLLREIIHELEESDEPEAGNYAWRLAEAMERCQEVEDELRVLRNGTEDKFARGQSFFDAIEPICDRLDRRGVQYTFSWLDGSLELDGKTWERSTFALAESARDRRVAATLYQVLSELTWNVIKYACLESEEVKLDIKFTCTRQDRVIRYTLEVEDNGPGFDVQTAQDRRPHSGIFSLERYLKRVEIVGAQARSVLQSTPGKGTNILTEIVAPIKKSAN
jgi:hypothetical protein